MLPLKSLLQRAQDSGDGEAYVPLTKGAGFRIGVGARLLPQRAPNLFVEVVLDPFPDRPRVSPDWLREQGERVARLQVRGYRVACDTDGTVTCERDLAPGRIDGEVRTLRRMLATRAGPGV